MYSFLKSKLQTAVVILLTLLMVSETGFTQVSETNPFKAGAKKSRSSPQETNPFLKKNNKAQVRTTAAQPSPIAVVAAAAATTPVAPTAPASEGVPPSNNSMPFGIGKSDAQVKQETRQECAMEFRSVTDPDERENKINSCVRNRLDSMDPARTESLCSDLRKQMNESITKCPSQGCQDVVDSCTAAGDSPESESVVNALLMQTTGFGMTGQSNVVNCNITYSEHRSELKERMTDVETIQKDISNQNKDNLKDQEDFQKQSRDIEDKQRELKKQQQDLIKEAKTKQRESFQKKMEERLKLDAQVRQSMLEISQMRSKLLQMTNAKKKMLGNFDVNNFVRACRGEYTKSRAEYCAKTRDNCKQQVYTSVGTAFTSGGINKSDRIASFDNCVKNTLLDYSTQIDSASEDLKIMQGQIIAKNEALDAAKEAQQKSDEFLMQELNEMQSDTNAQMQVIGEAFQTLEKQKMELQTNFQTQQLENLRRRMELNNRLGMKSSALGQVGKRPGKIHKDLTGNEAIGEVTKQQGFRQDAERLGCCKTGYSGTELCKESAAAKSSKNSNKKSGR